MLDRRHVLAPDLGRRVLGINVGTGTRRQRGAQAGVAAQQGQRGGQFGAGKIVCQLDQHVIGQFGARAVGVGDGRHAVQQAVEDGRRGLATRLDAQLDGGIGGCQPGTVDILGNEAGDLDRPCAAGLLELARKIAAVGAGIGRADKYQAAVRILRQGRRQPCGEQGVVAFCGAEQAERADDKIGRRQHQRAAGGGPLAVAVAPAQQRQRAPFAHAGRAVPLFGQLGRIACMHDHAAGLVEQGLVARVFPDRRGDAGLALVGQGGKAVRMIERLLEGAGGIAGVVEVMDDVAQVEIVQHHDSRVALEQGEHVLVHRRIAKVIEHAVIFMGMDVEPLDAAQRQVGLDPWIVDHGLADDQIDVVMACQFWHQFGAVVGDAAAFGRQR